MTHPFTISRLRGSRSPHILVVDPDPANRRLLAWTLRGEGFRVSEAAEAAAVDSHPDLDLIIADANLRDLQPARSHLPLVLMTASLSASTCERARRLGAACCIHRPIYVDEVKRAVARALTATCLDDTTTARAARAVIVTSAYPS